jgi:DNA mismatch endonuclease (patch repair protein)
MRRSLAQARLRARDKPLATNDLIGHATLALDNLSPERRGKLMSRVKSRDTGPEMTVRRLTFAMGYRYRLHDARLPGRPDLVFPARRKAIFVNGCFWHGHARCRFARLPKTRIEYWQPKIGRNRERDKENRAALKKLGWKTLTIWQCELKNPDRIARKIHDFLQKD